MNKIRSKRLTHIKNSGVLPSVRTIRIPVDFYRSRDHIVENDRNERLWAFAVYKRKNNNLIRLTYDLDWHFEYNTPSRTANLIIDRRDETDAFNDEEGMNGSYVIWNSTDRKGLELEITEDGPIPNIAWGTARTMAVEPYIANISVTINGLVNKEIEVSLYEQIGDELSEDPIAQKIGGAIVQRRMNSSDVITPTSDPTILISFLASKRELTLFADAVILDDSDPPKTKQLNNGNSFTVSPGNKDVSFDVTFSSFSNSTGPIVFTGVLLPGNNNKTGGLPNSEMSSELDRARQRLLELETARNEQESRLTTLTTQKESSEESLRSSRERQQTLETENREIQGRATSLEQREREALAKLEEESSKNKTLLIALGVVALLGGAYYYKKIYLPSKDKQDRPKPKQETKEKE